MIPFTGAFYKNGTKIGDVLSAVDGPHEALSQFGQANPTSEQKRITITIDRPFQLEIRQSAGEDLYEVDSREKRLQVFPVDVDGDRDTTRILISLTR